MRKSFICITKVNKENHTNSSIPTKCLKSRLLTPPWVLKICRWRRRHLPNQQKSPKVSDLLCCCWHRKSIIKFVSVCSWHPSKRRGECSYNETEEVDCWLLEGHQLGVQIYSQISETWSWRKARKSTWRWFIRVVLRTDVSNPFFSSSTSTKHSLQVPIRSSRIFTNATAIKTSWRFTTQSRKPGVERLVLSKHSVQFKLLSFTSKNINKFSLY